MSPKLNLLKRQKKLLRNETTNLVGETTTVAKSLRSLTRKPKVVVVFVQIVIEIATQKVLTKEVESAKVLIAMVLTVALSRTRIHGSGSFTTLNALSMNVLMLLQKLKFQHCLQKTKFLNSPRKISLKRRWQNLTKKLKIYVNSKKICMLSVVKLLTEERCRVHQWLIAKFSLPRSMNLKV